MFSSFFRTKNSAIPPSDSPSETAPQTPPADEAELFAHFRLRTALKAVLEKLPFYVPAENWVEPLTVLLTHRFRVETDENLNLSFYHPDGTPFTETPPPEFIRRLLDELGALKKSRAETSNLPALILNPPVPTVSDMLPGLQRARQHLSQMR